MREGEYELVYDPVDTHRATDKLQGCVIGIIEDEMIQVEIAQSRTANSTGHLYSVSLFNSGRKGDLSQSEHDSHRAPGPLSPWSSLPIGLRIRNRYAPPRSSRD